MQAIFITKKHLGMLDPLKIMSWFFELLFFFFHKLFFLENRRWRESWLLRRFKYRY